MTWTFFVLTCIIGIVIAQDDKSSLTLQLLRTFMGKCEKNRHPEVFQNIQSIFQRYRSCNPQTDVGKLEDIKKTCKTVHESDKCILEMVEAIKPCFSAEEQKNFDIILKVDNELTEFICYKDGDRISQFIAEGGPTCFKSKERDLQACLTQSFDFQTLSMDDLLDEEITEEECNIMTKFQVCAVNVGKTCNKPTVTNFVDSLFNVVRGATPCKNFNSATRFAATTGTVLMALTAAILV